MGVKPIAIAYFQNIKTSLSTLWTGLGLTFKHLKQAKDSRKPIGVSDPDYFTQDTGLATLLYPHESIPVPDNGRYRLHNEIDDCIVCDKCAKVCPVDCIDIEPIRSAEVFGHTSDGTAKRIYAAKFDIDMGKCCFCGLCTTVCPTECLTMTKAYDFSEYDVKDHIYEFATMTPLEILTRKKEFEEYSDKKAQQKTSTVSKVKPKPQIPTAKPEGEKSQAKPVFKPKVKATKPVMKPKISSTSGEKKSDETVEKPVKKVIAKPVIKPASNKAEGQTKSKPVMKPKIPSASKKSIIKPIVKPRPAKPDSENGDQ